VVTQWQSVDVKGPRGLDHVRKVIASGLPLVCGTFLYANFPEYNRNKKIPAPVPYVGNKKILYQKNDPTKKAVHCMMIIGYDDTLGGGAVLMQNSFGTDWGTDWSDGPSSGG